MNLLGSRPGGNGVKFLWVFYEPTGTTSWRECRKILTSRQISISYELPGTRLLGPERPALWCLVYSINLVFKWAELVAQSERSKLRCAAELVAQSERSKLRTAAELVAQSERSKLRSAAACRCRRKVMQGLCIVQRANSMYWQAETP